MARRLALATSPRRHRLVLRALRDGAITLQRALQVVSETACLSDADVATVEESVLAPTRDGLPLSQRAFTSRLRRAIAAVDERGAAERRSRARTRRGVYGRMIEDGMGCLTMTTDAATIAAILDRLDTAARALRAAGDPRTLDQLRCDLMADALLRGHLSLAGAAARPSRGAAGRVDEGEGPTRHAQDAGTGPARQQAFGSRGSGRRGSNEVPGTARHGPAGRAGPSRHEPDREPGFSEGASGRVRMNDPHPDPDPDPDFDPDPRAGSVCEGPPSSADVVEPERRTGEAPARAWIVVPFEVAVGLSDAPCELPGHGWVTAEHARAVMTRPGSVWHTLPVDVRTGEALARPTAGYRPTPAMVAHVRAVDGTCRAPGCEVLADRCDIDHETPYPAGPTAIGNLVSKHRHHHNLKTAGVWTTRPAADGESGTVEWTTLTGRTYLTRPKNWRAGVQTPSPTPPPGPSSIPPPGSPTSPPPGPPTSPPPSVAPPF
ncbi:HNH endonuclease signature motif containing protein [Terrabacter sp. NPDC000476]|uniref:HNH endonuclease signature motif containing protein n=1 Tax=Terrabacter sp. NPDC000476 TaxID=3154258 RepID=UPI0033251FE6